MFALSSATRVFLAEGATDLRRGFDGLHGLVPHLVELGRQVVPGEQRHQEAAAEHADERERRERVGDARKQLGHSRWVEKGPGAAGEGSGR